MLVDWTKFVSLKKNTCCMVKINDILAAIILILSLSLWGFHHVAPSARVNKVQGGLCNRVLLDSRFDRYFNECFVW